MLTNTPPSPPPSAKARRSDSNPQATMVARVAPPVRLRKLRRLRPRFQAWPVDRGWRAGAAAWRDGWVSDPFLARSGGIVKKNRRQAKSRKAVLAQCRVAARGRQAVARIVAACVRRRADDQARQHRPFAADGHRPPLQCFFAPRLHANARIVAALCERRCSCEGAKHRPFAADGHRAPLQCCFAPRLPPMPGL
jgi:hypothetical protein